MKTAEEILKEYGNWNKEGLAEWHKDCIIAAMEEYAQQQVKNLNIPAVSNRRELLFAFIKEWKEEFKDENWDYLDFVAERVLSKQ